MSGAVLRTARQAKFLTQATLARELGVSQGYVSLLEAGSRSMSGKLQRKLASVLDLGPTALPLPSHATPLPGDSVASALGTLGYPGFAHQSALKAMNPAQVLLGALMSPELDARLAEGLAWLLGQFADLDWQWLLPRAKQHDLQNRLGFLVELARGSAAAKRDPERVETLGRWRDVLEKSRLDRDEPLSMVKVTNVERRWLLAHRSPEARHWRVLSSLRPEVVQSGQGST
jgi:transcriptional regulator with XRE-family HTH domain